MVQERKERGVSVKEWCAGCGIMKHVYYYRLRLAAGALEIMDADRQTLELVLRRFIHTE